MMLLSFGVTILLVNFQTTRAFVSRSHAVQARSGVSPRYMFDFFKPNDDKPKDSKETKPEVPEPVPEPEFDDPVEKIFNVFFGKKEAEPMGLKRGFSQERFPEQYQAVIDQFAEPVASDTSNMAALRPLLKNTNLETRGLKLTYDANKHGWNADTFHKRVDKLGGALVVCTTSDGLICGGYNPKGWVGYGEARGSIAAFLFVYKRGLQELPSKLRKVGGPSLAQLDNPESGPCFGADSLVVNLDGKQARSKLGSYFERFPDGTNTLFGKRGASVDLKALKVYHGVYAEGEFIPFTDAEPFALY